MRLFSCLLLLSLGLLVNAEPTLETRSGCLTDDQATKLTNILVSVSVKFKIKDVSPYFTDDVYLQSDSIAFLLGEPPGFGIHSKQIFLQSSYNLTSTSQQPTIKVLDMFHNCHQVAFHWISESKPIPVRGIDMFWVKPGTMQISKDYSEFNDGADLINAKVFPCPNATTSTMT